MIISFKSFTQPSPLYEQSLVLRNRVLIEAVGRHENCRDFDFPDKDIYIAAFDSDKLIGAAIITPLDDNSVQMRQMAVDEEYQGKGVGRAIVREFERVVLELGYSTVMLHARETALPFYEKLGYDLCSDKFFEIEIAHYEMKKNLTQSR
jgi:GNAT superfamily N-acetyltransferase